MENKIDYEHILDNYKKLLEALKDEPDSARVATEEMQHFPGYINAVYRQVTLTPMLKMTCIDGEEYRQKAQELDEQRNRMHQLTIDACDILNRMCEKHGVEKFCPSYKPGFVNRYEIADFAADVTVRVFKSAAGTGKLLDNVRCKTDSAVKNLAPFEETEVLDEEPTEEMEPDW